MGNEGIFKGVTGEWRYGQGGRCLKNLTTPGLNHCITEQQPFQILLYRKRFFSISSSLNSAKIDFIC